MSERRDERAATRRALVAAAGAGAPRRTRGAGFTLVEVLAATALFVVLGTMLFQMVQGAMELWSRGQQVRETEEQAGAVLDLLAEDLRHLWPGIPGADEQDGRLLCGRRVVRRGGDGSGDQLTTVLRFTRRLHEQRFLPWLRLAGETPAAQGVATLTGEEDPAELRPTGGLAETLYTTALLPGETLPSLVRRVRTPLGGAGSLLDPELPEREDRLLTDAVRLADRVLHFELSFWAADTTAWDPQSDAPARTVWDSTRALLPPGDPSFPYGHGQGSLLVGDDDVFPRLVAARLVLDPYEGERLGSARLAADVSAEATLLPLSGPVTGDLAQAAHLWLDGEWVAVRSRQGRQLLVERGVWGTLRAPHGRGTAVRTGRAFERIIAVPAVRERVDP